MPTIDTLILNVWEKSRAALPAQLGQRMPDAVFLEGSVAEGFGNERSDLDFVAIIDDGMELPTMPYILFIDGRRIEVRLASSARIKRELRQIRAALGKGRRQVTSLSWNLLERCQRFMGALPIENPALIAALQAELGKEALGKAVALWFEDFACEASRYAMAMLALDQAGYARAWIRTAVFHAAKSHVAQCGEYYMGPKWLSLQMARACIAPGLVQRFWAFMREPGDPGDPSATSDEAAYVRQGIALACEFGAPETPFDPERVTIEAGSGVTTWQVGNAVHLLRGHDIFALSDDAARVWRSIAFGASCVAIAGNHDDERENRRRRGLLADFSRAGLISLHWKGAGKIRARRHATSAPLSREPVISLNGARLGGAENADVQLLPMAARRFAEAGLEMTWANIGLENAREDALGAFSRSQWHVLEYSLQRMVQTACMAALAAHGVTPQPPLEEAILEAVRVLRLDAGLANRLRQAECHAIASAYQAQTQFQLVNDIVAALRALSGEPRFPRSFDTASGWRGTILAAYDWINLGAHIGARFPQTAHGGRGTAEEARDLLASSAG